MAAAAAGSGAGSNEAEGLVWLSDSDDDDGVASDKHDGADDGDSVACTIDTWTTATKVAVVAVDSGASTTPPLLLDTESAHAKVVTLVRSRLAIAGGGVARDWRTEVAVAALRRIYPAVVRVLDEDMRTTWATSTRRLVQPLNYSGHIPLSTADRARVAAMIVDDIRHRLVKGHQSWRDVWRTRYRLADAEHPDDAAFIDAMRHLAVRVLEQQTEQVGVPRLVLQKAVGLTVVDAEPRRWFETELPPANQRAFAELRWMLAWTLDACQTRRDPRRLIVGIAKVPGAELTATDLPLWRCLEPFWAALPSACIDAVAAQLVACDERGVQSVTSFVASGRALYSLRAERIAPTSPDIRCRVSRVIGAVMAGCVMPDVKGYDWSCVRATVSAPTDPIGSGWLTTTLKQTAVHRSAYGPLIDADVRCRYLETRRLGTHSQWSLYDARCPGSRAADLQTLAQYAVRCAWSSRRPLAPTRMLWLMLLSDETLRQSGAKVYPAVSAMALFEQLPAVIDSLYMASPPGEKVVTGPQHADIDAWYDRFALAHYRRRDQQLEWTQFVAALVVAKLRCDQKTRVRVVARWMASAPHTLVLQRLLEHAPLLTHPRAARLVDAAVGVALPDLVLPQGASTPMRDAFLTLFASSVSPTRQALLVARELALKADALAKRAGSAIGMKRSAVSLS